MFSRDMIFLFVFCCCEFLRVRISHADLTNQNMARAMRVLQELIKRHNQKKNDCHLLQVLDVHIQQIDHRHHQHLMGKCN